VPVRLATTADLNAIGACARAAYAKYVVRIGREPAPMVADFEAAIGRGEVCVADIDGELAGYVVCYGVTGAMHLENIAVWPEQQGKGVGGVLLRHVEELARQQGLPAIELYTNLAMVENQGLYPALGYQLMGRKVEDGFERLYYRKDL